MRITTGAQNRAMRALAGKFGANLTFRHGESTGTIDLTPQPQPELESGKLESGKLAISTPFDAARAMAGVNRAYWKWWLQMYRWGRTA